MTTATASATGLVTAEELLAMPRDGKRYELIRGELVEKMPTGHPHAVVVKWTTFVLTEYEVETGYGVVVSGEPGYRLEIAPDTVRAPDVAWIAPGRIPPGTQGYPQLAPDLVVEVQSPRQNLRGKALMWLHYGCREVWVAVPSPRISVTRYRAGVEPVTLYEDDVLDGGDLLPGFRVPVWRLFRRHRRQVSLGEQAEEQV